MSPVCLLVSLFFTDTFCSGVGGVSVNELNQMELEFLKMIDFSLVVSDGDLSRVADLILAFSHTNHPESSAS